VGALKLCEEPVIRVLAVIVAAAAGIRFAIWLLWPVFPYIAAALIVFALLRVTRWYRGRW
jgi:hypothetical protein